MIDRERILKATIKLDIRSALVKSSNSCYDLLLSDTLSTHERVVYEILTKVLIDLSDDLKTYRDD